MAITVTINKYVEGFSVVPSTQGGNGTDLLGKETWYGTTPIVNAGRALEDSEGNTKSFATSLSNSSTKVGTRYLNTIYWKEEDAAYLSEVDDNWEYNGTKNIIINLYYGKTSGSTSYKPSEGELGPTGPTGPTTYSVKVYNYLDGIKNLLFTATSYGEIRVHTYSVDLTYMDDNETQQQLEGDIPISKRIQKVTVNGTDITNTNGWKSYYSDVEVIYYFESDNYTVTLNNQGATTAGITSVTAIYGSAMPSIASNLPKKTGYTFGGYYTGTNGSGTQYYKAEGSSAKDWDIRSNTTLYARWTINKYTLTWNANGGTLSGSYTSGSVEYGYPITTPSVSRTGYTFKGWSNGTSIVTPASTMPANNLTYTAQWTANNYTVVFNANGGTGTMQNQSFTYGTAKALTTNAFERSGYTFNGWNTEADGTGNSYTDKQSVNNLTSTNNGTVTLYAQWTADTITITWDPNGGSVLPTSSSYIYNGASVSLPTPSRTGYTFNGWYTASSGGTKITEIGTTNKPTANVTYYAQWSIINYTITYYIDGVKDTSLGNPTTYTVVTSTITLKNPTKSNYTGSGWRLNSASGAQYTQIVKGSYGHKTFYWTWTPNTYNLTWNPNGGNWNGSTDNIVNTCGYETTITKPSNPGRDGYSFNGWKDQDGNTTVVTTMPAKDLTYTAQWSANSYTINLNGGSSSQTSVRIKYGTNTFLNTSTSTETTITTPTKTGYTFLGWYTGSGGTGSLIINTSGILQANVPGYTDQNGKWTRTENVTVYAKWGGDACTITVNANPSYLSEYVSGGKSCKVGDSVTLSASTPGDYIVFNSWTYGNTFISSSNPYTFNAPGTRTYTGNFTDYRQKITFKIHVNPQHYTDTPDSIVDIFYGDTRTELSEVRSNRNGLYEFDSSTDITVNKYAGGSGTYLSLINGSLNSQGMYSLPTSLDGNSIVGIYIGKTPTTDSETYKENELVLDVYYGKLPSFSTQGGGSGSSIPSKQLKVRFNYWLEGVKLEKGTATWDSKWGGYTPPEEIETWWIQYNGFVQDKKDYNKNGIHFTHHEIGDYNYNSITDTPTQIQEKLEIQAPINCYVDSVNGFDNNDLSKEYNTLTNTSGILDVDINYKNVTYLAKATSNDTSKGSANVNGSGTNGTTDVEFIIGQQLTFNASPKTGYKFIKWVNKNNTSQEYTTNPYIIENAPAANVHYEAYFGPVEYTITLNPNGGSGSQSSVKVDYLSTSLKSTITEPTRTGYTFNGWYTASSGGSLIIDTDGKSLNPNVSGYTNGSSQWTKTSGTTLYAQWTAEEYTITLNPNGGSGSQSSVKVDYLSTSLKSTITEPTRTGYTFNGWYTASSGGSLIIDTDGKSLNPNVSGYTNGSSQWTKTSGTTLYAQWAVNSWTLTWDLKGGTVTTAGTCAPLNSTGAPTGQVDYLSSITAPIVSKNGYTFLGWSANGDDVITPASKMPNGNLKYIAVYSPKTYKITVNSIPSLDKVYIKVNDVNKGTTTTCTTNDKITLIAENVNEYLLSYWQKSGGNVVSGQNEFTFTANDTYLDDAIDNNIFTAYYEQDPRATLKINFIVDDFIEKTAIFKFTTTFSFLGKSSTEGYRCEIQGEAECINGDISINQGYFFIPSKYNGEDICDLSGTKIICSNKGTTIGRDGYNSQYYEDNTVKNKYCPIGFEWQAYLPTNIADETHLVFPSVEKEEYGVLYGPLVIDVYYGEIPGRFLPVVPDDVEITTVSGLTLLQRIQNKIATFKWLNNLFGEPEKTSWDSYDNSGLKGFLKDDNKETPLSMHCIEYGDLQIYSQETGNENINLDKTIKQYSLTLDKIIKPLNGQIILDVSKIEGNKIYFNISNSNGFANTSNGIYIYFSVNNETDENNATLYKMKLPKTPSNKGLLLTIPDVSNIESLYIYRTPIMVDSTKTGITPKIYVNYENGIIDVYDRTTLNNVVI